MKKILAAAALAVVCLTPLSTAKADVLSYTNYCTSFALSINWCGSITVTATPNGSGGTDVVMTVLNQSGGPLGGDPLAVFTSIGLDNVSNAGALSAFSVVSNGVDYTSHWELNKNESVGGGVNIDINASTFPGSTINFGISSACSGALERIYTGGAGGCASNVVTISFTYAGTLTVANAQIFVKAQGGELPSSECLLGTPSCPTTTIPEPASIVLVGTGLIALGRRASRWRRRNQNA